MHDVDQSRLDQLCDGKRGGYAYKRFVGKADCAFRDCMNVACEAEFSEIVDQVVAKPSGTFQPIDLGSRKTQRLEVGESVLKSPRKQEIASRRQSPHEELKYGRFLFAMIQVGLDHIEFVKVSGERAGRWCHVDLGRESVSPLFCPAFEHGSNARAALKQPHADAIFGLYEQLIEPSFDGKWGEV